jgi:hypothetical protein
MFALGGIDNAMEAIQELRDRRNNWSQDDQRSHLKIILGADFEFVERVSNSGTAFGIQCCDSHLSWIWGHSAHHCGLVTKFVAELDPDADALGGRSNAERRTPKSAPTKAVLLEKWFDSIVDKLGCNSPKVPDTVFLHGFTLRGNLFPLMKLHFKLSGIENMIPVEDYFVKVWCRLFGKKGQQIRSEAGKKRVRLRQDITVGKCKECQRFVRFCFLLSFCFLLTCSLKQHSSHGYALWPTTLPVCWIVCFIVR